MRHRIAEQLAPLQRLTNGGISLPHAEVWSQVPHSAKASAPPPRDLEVLWSTALLGRVECRAGWRSGWSRIEESVSFWSPIEARSRSGCAGQR
jgi:hypothetical protein